MIAIRGLSHRILSIPDLVLPEGRTVVIGPNGGGKTTLLRLFAGIDLPSGGEILIDGLPPRSREVGWVGENPEQAMVFTRVFDEIASPLRFRRDPCTAVDDRVKAIAGELGIGNLFGREIRTLSAGEKTKVALAAALAASPEILVMDEADSNLDRESAGGVEDLVLRSPCSHVIQVTQRMDLAARADLLVYLEGGRVIHAGSPAGVFTALSGTPFIPPTRGWRR
jgi:energy-coupling factor transporter ATP-binding protein EcfA2